MPSKRRFILHWKSRTYTSPKLAFERLQEDFSFKTLPTAGSARLVKAIIFKLHEADAAGAVSIIRDKPKRRRNRRPFLQMLKRLREYEGKVQPKKSTVIFASNPVPSQFDWVLRRSTHRTSPQAPGPLPPPNPPAPTIHAADLLWRETTQETTERARQQRAMQEFLSSRETSTTTLPTQPITGQAFTLQQVREIYRTNNNRIVFWNPVTQPPEERPVEPPQPNEPNTTTRR